MVPRSCRGLPSWQRPAVSGMSPSGQATGPSSTCRSGCPRRGTPDLRRTTMTTLQDPAAPPVSTAAPAGTTVDEFADRVLTATLGAFDTLNVYLSDRLGWYRTM